MDVYQIYRHVSRPYVVTLAKWVGCTVSARSCRTVLLSTARRLSAFYCRVCQMVIEYEQVLLRVIWEERVAIPHWRECTRPLHVLAAQYPPQTNPITQPRVRYIHTAIPRTSYTLHCTVPVSYTHLTLPTNREV